MVEELEDGYRIVEEPGAGVLYLRFAIGDLFLKRKVSKNPLAYTPVGATIHWSTRALSQKVTKNFSLVQVSVEAELLDSQTGEKLAAVVTRRGVRKDKEAGIKGDPSSWKEVRALMREYGARLRCRMDNARIPEDEWVDCRERDKRAAGPVSGKKPQER